MYGARCVHCGFQEGEHYDGSAQDDAEEIFEGFTHSLYSCDGFLSQNPEMEILEALEIIRHITNKSPVTPEEFMRDMSICCDLPRGYGGFVIIRLGDHFAKSSLANHQ
jgi:hypothetical protein